MASALLAILQPPPQNRRVGEATRELNGSTFSGRLMTCRNSIRRGDSRIISAALLGRRSGRTAKRKTLIPDPDYRIPVVLLGSAGGLVYSGNLIPAVPVGLLGLLLLVQTTRVRFVFDDEALEVKVGEELRESGENVFVGGKNRWKYSTFVNWELWWPNFPILVYFKETQTKPEGQIHFFPVIFNGKQLYDAMVERAGPSKTSRPK
ncbi:hypothetical protein Dimus_023514 [Dionaea muscipula]